MLIAAFPGTGKSYLAKQYPEIFVDIDSGFFHTLDINYENEDFIEDYHKAIIMVQNKHVFTSCHVKLLKKFEEAGLDFTIVIPKMDAKEEYFQRYIKRGNKDKFLEDMFKYWESWLTNIHNNFPDKIIELKPGQVLADVIEFDEDLDPTKIKISRFLEKYSTASKITHTESQVDD